MSITQQIIQLSDKYNDTDKIKIKRNIIHYIKQSGYNKQSHLLAELLGVSIQTVYSYRKLKNGNIPDFITALKLCNVLGIGIDDLIK